MKRLLFILGFLVIQHTINAQSGADSAFTLQQCIDYAMKHHYSVVNAEIDQQITNAKVNEIKAAGYPSINGTVQMINNPQLKKLFLPNNQGGFFPFDPTKPEGSAIPINNIFQLKNYGDASATINQLIFDGSYLVGLQTNSTYKEMAKQSTIMTKIQTIEDVKKAYYLVLISNEQFKSFDVNLKRLDSALFQTKVAYENGLVEEIDVKRLEVQYNNLLTEKENTKNLLILSQYQLKLNMGMPYDQSITLTDSLRAAELESTIIPTSQFDPTTRIEYSLTRSQEQMEMFNLKRIKYSRLPTLAAFATGGYNIQDVKFGYLFSHRWYTYSLVGLNLSIPILDLTKNYQAQQSKYAIQKYSNTLNNLQNAFKVQEAATLTTYNNKVKAMQNQKRNMELAQQVVKVTKIKYQEGVGSNIELVNAEADLQQAQINYYQALYDAVIAKIAHQKATGTLYNGQ